MENELNEYVQKSNSFIERIEDKNYLKKNSDKIIKLEYYKFGDFINVSHKIESYLSQLTDEISKILPENIDSQGIDFLLYELLINIYKHSKFENAYIQLDIENNEKIIEIYIIDDGIGIPGSFRETSFDYDNDSEALFDAINGKTTDKEKYNLHGRGLNSSSRITTRGFDGEMLIASGRGICIINKDGAKTCNNEKKVNGTFINLRLNNIKIENIYECLRFEKINRIAEVNHG